MKRCSRCKKEKMPGEYSKNKNTRDGLNTYCRECYKVIQREYRHKWHTKPKGET